MKRILLLLTLCLHYVTLPTVSAQSGKLKPGFDKAEYLEMLSVTSRQIDTLREEKVPGPKRSRRLSRSPVVGLDNRWELWLRDDGVGIISLRGTTEKAVSWLENFYAAMVPATGQLELGPGDTFSYKLANNPRAAVHVGWLLGVAYMSKTILPKIDSCSKAGINEFIIIGHSQGGALSFLLTSYLNYLRGNRLPANLRIKTYCSAAPKPGNLHYAYDYEAMTQGGWGFNVVNAADWVPQTPFSIQTIDDYSPTNPFKDISAGLKKQKFFQRIALNYAFKKMDRPTRKAQKEFQRFLGNFASKTVQKNLPGYKPSDYFKSNHYVRTGQFIVLYPNEAYYQKFPDNTRQVFIHHFFEPYFMLTNQLTL